MKATWNEYPKAEMHILLHNEKIRANGMEWIPKGRWNILRWENLNNKWLVEVDLKDNHHGFKLIREVRYDEHDRQNHQNNPYKFYEELLCVHRDRMDHVHEEVMKMPRGRMDFVMNVSEKGELLGPFCKDLECFKDKELIKKLIEGSIKSFAYVCSNVVPFKRD